MFKQWLMSNYSLPSKYTSLQRIAVVGSGSWATALVKVFSDSGLPVSWLVRDNEQAEYIKTNGRNPRYLSFASLQTASVTASADPKEILTAPDIIIFAVPAAYLEDTVNNIAPELLTGKRIVVSIKGFIPGTGYIPSVYMSKKLMVTSPVTVLGGPCHAEEIANHGNTYITIAGEDKIFIEQMCESLRTSYIHTVSNADATGVEYVSILKNIIGIATGIANGLNYGVNFQAVLVSNAMREISDFLNAVDPKDRCLFDSVYFGDLLVTAYSDYSRNRTLGKLVGRGMHVTRAIQSMEMTAEGYHASGELTLLKADLQVTMPVINSVCRILHQHANPFHEFKLIEKQLR